jgi:biopolymer transport protein TolR
VGFSDTSHDDGPNASINVTPLVDVMLVLLVIFMVTAPMMQEGVEVNLPKATTGALKGSSEQVVISVDKQGEIYLGAGNKIIPNELGPKVKAIMEKREPEDRKIYIKGDTGVVYGKMIEVMAALHQAGITQIGLVSSPGSGAPGSSAPGTASGVAAGTDSKAQQK